jgi:hypothetical protein
MSGHPSISSLEQSRLELPTALLSRLDLEVWEVRPISWKQPQVTPLYYLEAAEGRFVLKLATPRPSRVAGLRAGLARNEIGHQARVYMALGRLACRHLRFPKLIASDFRSYLLLEYIETRPHGEHDLPRDAVLGSLLEFQTADVDIPDPVFPNAARTPGVRLARRLVGRLRKRIGWPATRRALLAAGRCYHEQPRMKRKVVRHNDFHYNNLLLADDGAVYMNDFEYVSLDDRWVLGDIINYAVGTRYFHIAVDIIREYAKMMADALDAEVCLPAQLRFCLLSRVGDLLLSRVAPAEVVSRYWSFFESVLLDDREFARWLGSRLEREQGRSGRSSQPAAGARSITGSGGDPPRRSGG